MKKSILKTPKLKFKPDAEQDNMIARGIKLLSTKLLDFIQLANKSNVDYSTVKSYSLLRFDVWQNSVTSLVQELKAWEIAHVGEL